MERFLRIILLGAVAWLAGSRMAPAQTTNEISRLNLPYGENSYQVLDVFSTDGLANAPVMMLLHGGGGAKEDWHPFRRFFLDLGFVVVTPQYNGSLTATTDAIADTTLAYNWIRANVASLGGDPGRVNVAGSSAGGYVAAMLAYDRQLGFRTFLGLAGLYRGDPFAAGAKERPIEAVNAGDPPGFFCHGDADDRAPLEESIQMAATLDAAGIESQLFIIPGAGHPTIKAIVFGEPQNEYVRDALAEFLLRNNGGPSRPLVSVTSPDADAAEAGLDPATLTVARAGGTNAALTVKLTVAGTATPDADYAALPAAVTLPAGVTTTNLIVRPLSDSTDECDETIGIAIAADAAYTVDGARASVTVQIGDDDLPVVRITAPDANAAEAGQAPGIFVVTRSGCLSAALSVSVNISGTASSGADYSPLPATLSIPAGTNSIALTVAPVDDAVFEADESVTVALLATPNYNVGANGSATVTIADNDPVTGPPVLACSVAALPAQTIAPGETAPAQTFQVWNAGPGTLSYTVSDNAPWVSVSPTGGSSAGAATTHTVSYITAGLSPGTYASTVTVTGGSGTQNSPQTIAVSVTVAACSYSAAPALRTFGRTAGVGTIAVNAAGQCPWTASTTDSWIAVTGGASGSGTGTVSYSVAANPNCLSRSGVVVVAGQTITIRQMEGVGTFAIAPTSRVHGAGSETGTIAVSASSGCAWGAATADSWISITGGATGTGAGTVSYAVMANTSSLARTGTIAVAGQTFAVTQDGDANNGGTGLLGQYFDDDDFTNWEFARTDAVVDFDWGSGSPDSTIGGDTFSARWTGQVAPYFTETYTFYVVANNGVRLWVGGELIIDSWTDQNAGSERSGTIALTGGQRYDIQLEFYENTGTAAVRLMWSSASQAKEVIPQKRLHGSPGLLGEYYNDRTLSGWEFNRLDSTVDFDWGSGSPDASVGGTFSVRWTGQVTPQYSETYTLYTVSDDGIRLWVNGQLLIDHWDDHSATEDSGTIALQAGQRYDIKVEYYERNGSATARLLWSSPSLPKEVVPASRLSTTFSQTTYVGQ